MACDPLRYERVDAATWARAQETISKAYGLSVESESGQESKSGFTMTWTYDADAQTLVLQCLDKPFLIPCGVVNGRINSLAEQSGIEPAARS